MMWMQAQVSMRLAEPVNRHSRIERHVGLHDVATIRYCNQLIIFTSLVVKPQGCYFSDRISSN